MSELPTTAQDRSRGRPGSTNAPAIFALSEGKRHGKEELDAERDAMKNKLKAQCEKSG